MKSALPCKISEPVFFAFVVTADLNPLMIDAKFLDWGPNLFFDFCFISINSSKSNGISVSEKISGTSVLIVN